MDTDIFKGVGIEVELPTQDSFLKVKETLTRIGISSRKERSFINLVISCTSKVDTLFYISKNYSF